MLVTLIAAAPYLGGLGFSSDDWSFLSDFVLSRDQSFIGLVRSLAPEGSIASRPLQAAQLVALYQAFACGRWGTTSITPACLRSPRC